jgi:hypothetical protein
MASTLNVKLWKLVTALWWWRAPRFLEQPSPELFFSNLFVSSRKKLRMELLDCEGQCAPWPRWAAKRQCALLPQTCRRTSLPPARPHSDILYRNRGRNNNCSNLRQCRRKDTANDPNSRKVNRRKGYGLLTVQIEQYLLCSAAQLTS